MVSRGESTRDLLLDPRSRPGKRVALKDSVKMKLLPTLRYRSSFRRNSNGEIEEVSASPSIFKNLSDVISFAAVSTLKSRVKMDIRHMWIAKRLAQSSSGNVPVELVEEAISSPMQLEKINEFLGPGGRRSLFCSCSFDDFVTLRIEFYPFETERGKIVFIVRVDDLRHSLPVEKFQEHVIVGESNASFKTLSSILHRVYIPLLSEESDWGASTSEDKSDFQTAVSRFSMTLTDIVNTLESQVELTKVDPSLLLECESFTASRGQSLSEIENVVIGWHGAAESLLTDQDPTLYSLEDIRPDAPLQFWRQRLANLNALMERMDLQETKDVISALAKARSPLVSSWLSIESRLRDASMEALENVKHLSALEFDILYEGTPGKITEVLGTIFLRIKRVRVMSRYLQNTAHMDGLLVKVTNQIIASCKSHILQGGSLWDQDCSDLLMKLKECLNLNGLCQHQYRVTKHEKIGTARELPFSFDESKIFAKFELFASRLEKLIDVFETYYFFQKLSSQEVVDAEDICAKYFEEVKALNQRPYDLLDYTETVFDGDYDLIRTAATQLEATLCKIIDRSFESIQSTDRALDLLAEFNKLLARDSLRAYLNQKQCEIFERFTHEMDTISNMYETNKVDPPLARHAPPVAGRILWVRQLLRLLEVPMQKFRDNGALLISASAKEIIKKYNCIAKTLVKYEIQWERAWRATADHAKQCLNASLIVRHPADQRLHLNFDPAIVQVLRECHYMQKLQIQLPDSALSILERGRDLKIFAQHLGHMLRSFESVNAEVLPELLVLLQPFLTEAEGRIQPGLTSITWSSANVETFIAESLDTLREFQASAEKMRDIYENRVLRNLRTISRCQLVYIPPSPMTVDALAKEQARVLKESVSSINLKSLEIEMAVKDCVDIAHGLFSSSPWTTTPGLESTAIDMFYRNAWELLYNAVLAAVRISIDLLKNRIRCANKLQLWTLDQPLFWVDVDLVSGNLQMNPMLDDVQNAINCFVLGILRSVDVTPWASQQREVRIGERVRGSRDIVRVILLLTGCITRLSANLAAYLDSLGQFDIIWVKSASTQLETFVESDPTPGDFVEKITFHDNLMLRVAELPSTSILGPLCLSLEPLKRCLTASTRSIKFMFCEKLCTIASKEVVDCSLWIQDMLARLSCEVRDLDDVRHLRSAIKEIIAETSDLEQRFSRVDSIFFTAQDFGYTIPADGQAQRNSMLSEWSKLQATAAAVAENLRLAHEDFKSDLLMTRVRFHKEVKQFYAEFFSEGPMHPRLTAAEATTRLRQFQHEYTVKFKKNAALQEGEELFGLPVCNYRELDEIRTCLSSLHQLYALHAAVSQTFQSYHGWTPLKMSKTIGAVEQEVSGFHQRLQQIPQQYWEYLSFKELKENIEHFSLTMPLLALLTSQGMQARHWEEVTLLTGTALNFEHPDFSVKDLVEIDLLKHQDGLEFICQTAGRELECEQKLGSISERWSAETLSFQNYKSMGPVLLDLAETGSLAEAVEESQAVLAALMESKFAVRIGPAIVQLRGRLAALLDLLDLWLDVQLTFCNVDALVSLEDASRQLPQEVGQYQSVCSHFVSVSQDAYSVRTVMALLNQEEAFRAELGELKNELEECRKFLSIYLNNKRGVFPRLFFVSDTTLVDFLSSGRDLQEKKRLISFLFDNVCALVASEDDPDTVCGIQSGDGEVVTLATPVSLDLNIEKTLKAIENEMRKTVQSLFESVRGRISEAFLYEDFDSFLSDFPGQACVFALHVWWTIACTESFRREEPDLASVFNRISSFQGKLISILSLSVAPKDRVKVESFLEHVLIQLEITGHLQAQSVSSPSAFDWQKQLRTRWNPDGAACEVLALDHALEHSYEYTGCRKALVIPCASNRSHLFVMECVGSVAGCRLVGPAEACKVETLRELGRRLGRFVASLACAPALEHDLLLMHVRGACESGAWCCFDEVERVSGRVLAELASSLASVLDAQRAKAASFVCGDGQSLALRAPAAFFLSSSCAAHEADSPAARAVPSALRSQLRTLMVLPPDSGALLRVRLRAGRFEQWDALASKIQCLYRLCARGLDYREEYDFGFRDLAAVLDRLLAAREKHSDAPHFDEVAAAASCLSEAHSPRLRDADAAIYAAMLSQVFDGAAAAAPVGGGGRRDPAGAKKADPRQRVRRAIEGGPMRHFPDLAPKLGQLVDSAAARSGLILCGPSCSGKSLCLAGLLGVLAEARECPQRPVHINPLAVEPDHVFGHFDARTRAWSDGILALLLRKALRSKSLHTWIVFDGPLDSWADGLEGLLDEGSRQLALCNGDRLPLPDGCGVVFEAENLRGVSPAAVSRAGVVCFCEPPDGALSRLTEAWLAGRREQEAELLRPLLASLLGPTWRFVAAECRPLAEPQPRAQMQGLLALLASLLSESVAIDEVPDVFVLERYVILAVAWACMGLLGDVDRARVNAKLQEQTANIPSTKKSRTVLESALADSEAGRQVWVPLAPFRAETEAVVQRGRAGLCDLFVPTALSEGAVRLNALLQAAGVPLFLFGEAGCGKSAVAGAALAQTLAGHRGGVLASRILLAPGHSASDLQDLLFRRVRARKGRVYGPPAGKRLAVLIEDLNVAAATAHGEHPVCELVRSLLERGFVYSHGKLREQLVVQDTRLLSTLSSRPDRPLALPRRLARHVFLVSVPSPGQEALKAIFEPVLSAQFHSARADSVSPETLTSVRICLDATFELAAALRQRLGLAVNLHCLSRIVRGMAQARPAALPTPVAAISLWLHECRRELMDRLRPDEQAAFEEEAQQACQRHFGPAVWASSARNRVWTAIFGFAPADGRGAAPPYRAVDDPDALAAKCAQTLEALNSAAAAAAAAGGSPGERLSLSLFGDLVLRLVRLVRVLGLERGHAVLVSHAMEGKLSLTRLACFALNLGPTSLTLLPKAQPATADAVSRLAKDVYAQAGVRGRPAVLGLAVNHATPDDVLQLLSQLAGSPSADIFGAEEWEALLAAPGFQKAVEDERSRSEALQYLDVQQLFLHRAQRLTHLVVCFSMSADGFRRRVEAAAPALAELCTVNLWAAPSLASLESVARQQLDEVARRLEAHRTEVANPYIEAELMKKIRDQEEQDLASGSGIGRWNAADVEQAIAEAIAEEARLREDLTNKVRQEAPKQMALLHAAALAMHRRFNARRGRRDHDAACSLQRFRLYAEQFCEVYAERFADIYSRHLTLKGAIEALEACDRDVSSLQSAASSHRPKAADASTACDMILEEMKVGVADLEQARARHAAAEAQRRELQVYVDEVRGEAERLLGGFDEAIREARALAAQFTAESVREVLELAPPPHLITQIFDVVLILRHRRLSSVAMTIVRGRAYMQSSWSHAQEYLRRPEGFLADMAGLDYFAITPEQVELMAPYLGDEDFTAEKAQFAARGASLPFMRWILRVEAFCREYAGVSGLVSAYAHSQARLARLGATVPASHDAVLRLSARVDACRRRYEEAVSLRHRQESADESRLQTLARAKALIRGLKPQKGRWANELLALDAERQNLAGNCSVYAGFMAYCGAFDAPHRRRALEDEFPRSCAECHVPCAAPLDVVGFLHGDAHLARMRLQGLPDDPHCAQSALIAARSRLWPLIVDPFEAAGAWLRGHIAGSAGDRGEYRELHVGEEAFLALLQECVRFGVAAIVRGVNADIEHDVSELLLVRSGRAAAGGARAVRIGSGVVDYNEAFRAFFVASHASPSYSEQFASSLTMVDFASRAEVLDGQLLDLVLRVESPDIEARRAALLAADVEFGARIQDQRKALLALACSLDGKVLDRPEVLRDIDEIRGSLQAMTRLRGEKFKELEAVARVVDRYLAVARRCGAMLWCAARLEPLHPLYGVSVAQFGRLVTGVLREPSACADVGERVELLVRRVTSRFLGHMSAAVLPAHRAVWALLLAMGLDPQCRAECDRYARALAEPPPRGDDGGGRAPFDWLTQEAALGLARFVGLFDATYGSGRRALRGEMADREEEWRAWYESEDPEKGPPDVRGQAPTPLEQLALVRFLRRDRFLPACARYFSAVVGVADAPEPGAGDPALAAVREAARSADPATPVILVASDALEAIEAVSRAAADQGTPCRVASLAPHQAGAARTHLAAALLAGSWLVLEGARLDPPRLASLPHLLARHAGAAKAGFRLFVLAGPADGRLPDHLLRQSLVRFVDPPRGLRAALARAAAAADDSPQLGAVRDATCQRLTHGLAFLYAAVVGRARFRGAGWAGPCDLRRDEPARSLRAVVGAASQMLARGHGSASALWDSVRRMAAETGFGREVSDPQDRRVLAACAQRLLSPRLLQEDFELLPSLRVPSSSGLPAACRLAAAQLPDDDMDEARAHGLGLHAGRQVLRDRAGEVLRAVGEVSAGGDDEDGGGGGEPGAEAFLGACVDEMAEALAAIAKQAARAWDPGDGGGGGGGAAGKRGPDELWRLFVASEIRALHAGVDGLGAVVRDYRLGRRPSAAEDREALDALRRGLAPAAAVRRSWPAASLAAWVRGLKRRWKQLQTWLEVGPPSSYWLGGFANPSRFVLLARLEACRRAGWPVEGVRATLEPDPGPAGGGGGGGKAVHGLCVVGAAWDDRAGKLALEPEQVRPCWIPQAYLISRRQEGRPAAGAAAAAGRPRDGPGFRVPCYRGPRMDGAGYVVDACLPTSEPANRLALASCHVVLHHETSAEAFAE